MFIFYALAGLFTFLVLYAFVTTRRWVNTTTEGTSDAELIAAGPVYPMATAKFDHDWLGINIYFVDEGNLRKIFDNIIYQRHFIEKVGALWNFSIKKSVWNVSANNEPPQTFVLWLNYYSREETSRAARWLTRGFRPTPRLSNGVEFFKAWGVAGRPMVKLTESFEWFGLDRLDQKRETGVVFPSSTQDIETEVPYRKFRKFEQAKKHELPDDETVRAWESRIASEGRVGHASLLLQYFVVREESLDATHSASQAIADDLTGKGAALLKYSSRKHGAYLSFVWVMALPEGFESANRETVAQYMQILRRSIVFERVIVPDRAQVWPETYEELPVVA